MTVTRWGGSKLLLLLAIAERPDLVLLDLGLPDGDGLDVARELLARWARSALFLTTILVAVIYLTLTKADQLPPAVEAA